ncbi:hypothetical protein GCM10010515_36540 [Streptomyces fructofermentans]|uniref:Uncharacterized protein n=1 Tax=Streptomyces fructofermentans TaxID=152141 RepID=A0A918KIY9_9ACTN|nr:hypothetical protein GCM10010515_36540 [Streptomyces fructofermentans]
MLLSVRLPAEFSALARAYVVYGAYAPALFRVRQQDGLYLIKTHVRAENP